MGRRLYYRRTGIEIRWADTRFMQWGARQACNGATIAKSTRVGYRADHTLPSRAIGRIHSAKKAANAG
jgi:hypothetical protein